MNALDRAFIGVYGAEVVLPPVGAAEQASAPSETTGDVQAPPAAVTSPPPPHFPAAAAAELPTLNEALASPEVDEPAEQAASTEPRAQWEVDRFQWPEVCDCLSQSLAEPLAELAQRIGQELAGGRRLLAMTGYGRGEGASTLLMCLARQIATGRSVALVDADFDRPRLGRRLGLVGQPGWERVLLDGAAAADTAVASVDDQLTLLPLGDAVASLDAGELRRRSQQVLDELAGAFDAVLIDAGPLFTSGGRLLLGQAPAVVPLVVIAQDVRRTTQFQLDDVIGQLELAGAQTVGIIENFIVRTG